MPDIRKSEVIQSETRIPGVARGNKATILVASPSKSVATWKARAEASGIVPIRYQNVLEVVPVEDITVDATKQKNRTARIDLQDGRTVETTESAVLNFYAPIIRRFNRRIMLQSLEGDSEDELSLVISGGIIEKSKRGGMGLGSLRDRFKPKEEGSEPLEYDDSFVAFIEEEDDLTP